MENGRGMINMWKKWFIIVVQITVLFLLSLFGTWLQQTFHLVIPGSVIGLILLFTLLYFNIIPETWIKQGASFMTKHLILFFIPATVGIIEYYQLFSGKGSLVILITVVSTIIVFALAGWTSEKMAAWRRAKHE